MVVPFFVCAFTDVTLGTNEPYRMFTSRAEYRLSLRQDNADLRLTQKGIDYGIVSQERQDHLRARELGISGTLSTLKSISLPRTEWAVYGEDYHMRQKDGKHKNAIEVLSMPNITLSHMIECIRDLGTKRNDPHLSQFEVSPLVFDTVEATAKYSNYLARQEDEMAKWRRSGAMIIPPDIVFTHDNFPAFSAEELEKLRASRPATLHEASQLQGLTPHTLVYLYNYVSRGKHVRAKAAGRSNAASESDASTSSLV
jgi:tRNA uridine 5-carboxymethylaminomethyl modification enzyme